MSQRAEVVDRLRLATGERLVNLDPSISSSNKAAAARAIARLAEADSTGVVFVRTVPITPDSRPREPTKVCALNFSTLVRDTWSESEARRVLSGTVLVPVLKPDTAVVEGWRLGEALPLEFDSTTWDKLHADYALIRSIVMRGQGDSLSSARPPAGHGDLLTAKTAGRNRLDVIRYEDSSGDIRVARRRGLYLRPEVTSRAIRSSIGIRSETDLFMELMRILQRERPSPEV